MTDEFDILDDEQLMRDLGMAELKRRQAETTLYEAQTIQAHEETRLRALETKNALRSLESIGLYGEDTGTFSYNGVIVDDMVNPFMYKLNAWSLRNPGKDITVVFNSPGGLVFDGLALYDFLLELKRRGHKVTTKALGAVMSMGAILLQAGDERIMSSSSFFLIHEVSLYQKGDFSTSDTEDILILQKKLQKKLCEHLSARSNLTSEEIELKWKKLDWLMNADEALELGFVDKIE